MTNLQIDLKDRVEFAERQLDRTHALFSRVDAKASALLAFASAEVAVLVLNLKMVDFGIWYISVPSGLFACSIVFVGIHFYNCAFPHLSGGHQSLIYFKEIATRTELNYVNELSVASQEQLLQDISGQIWRNSEIVSRKFNSIALATKGLLVSLVFWSVCLIAIALTRGEIH